MESLGSYGAHSGNWGSEDIAIGDYGGHRDHVWAIMAHREP